jgi:hypothetical protein
MAAKGEGRMVITAAPVLIENGADFMVVKDENRMMAARIYFNTSEIFI